MAQDLPEHVFPQDLTLLVDRTHSRNKRCWTR